MTTPLARAAKIIAELRESLKAAYQLEDGDEALETTLEGASLLPEMLAHAMRQAVALDDHIDAIKDRVDLMQGRAARLSEKKDTIRAAVLHAMQEAGLKRIPPDALPEMTVSVSGGRGKLFIKDETKIPDYYQRIIREPNRSLIREALEKGERLEWAEIGNPQKHLNVKAT